MRVLEADPASCRAEDLARAIQWMRDGGLVVFPTDTFYGVTADPSSRSAILSIFAWKGRGASSALPLVAADEAQVRAAFGEFDPVTAAIARRWWPGPVSVVVPAREWLAPEVHAGRGTVAVRVPDARIARALAEAWGRPLPATSANASGAPAVVDVGAIADLVRDARVLVIDGGVTPGGAASTIVDARATPPTCVRDGAVPWNRVLESIADARAD